MYTLYWTEALSHAIDVVIDCARSRTEQAYLLSVLSYCKASARRKKKNSHVRQRWRQKVQTVDTASAAD